MALLALAHSKHVASIPFLVMRESARGCCAVWNGSRKKQESRLVFLTIQNFIETEMF